MNFKDYKKLKDISCCFVDDKVLEISGGWRWHDDADALICILWQISNKLLNTLHSMPQRNYNKFFAANHIGKFFGIPFRRGETWGTIGTGFKIGPSLGSDQTAQCFTTSKIISFPTFPFLSIFYPVCCETSNSNRKTSGMRSSRDQTSTNQMTTTEQESFIGRSVKNTFLVSQILVLVQTALVRGWKFMGMRLSAFHCVWCHRPEVFRVFFSVF